MDVVKIMSPDRKQENLQGALVKLGSCENDYSGVYFDSAESNYTPLLTIL